MSRFSPLYLGTLPLLADINEQNIAFVICASENKPSSLHILKELLIKTLFSLASKSLDSMFNIVSCTSKVLKWQTGLVKCSLPNITKAAAWIRALQVKNADGTLSAVAEAMEDPTCQAVYLFTSGLPEHAVEELYRHLQETQQAFPVHVVYLPRSGEESQSSFQRILEKAANMSGGSFQAIRLNSGESSDEDNPGCTTSIQHSDCVSKQCCSPLLTGHHSVQFPLSIWNPDSFNTFLRSSVKKDLADSSPKIHSLLRGIRVLARKETDGYYYLGHIVQEVKGSRDCVLIEFEKSQRSRKGKAQFLMQETPLYDVIHYEDARWQPLTPGDGILAPWEKKGERYGPGTVLQVAETEVLHSAFKNSWVLVNFWNGQTKKVSADVAVRIPPSLSERIILEVQMPLAARQMLVEQNPDYPYVVPPGYRASGPCKKNHLHWHDVSAVWSRDTSYTCTHLPCCYFGSSSWEPTKSPLCTMQPDDALIPGTNLTKEELNKKIEEQLSKGRLPISENDENEMREWQENSKLKQGKNFTDPQSGAETDSRVTEPNKVQQGVLASEDPRERRGTMVDAAVNRRKYIIPQKQRAQPFQRSHPQITRIADVSQAKTTFSRVDRVPTKDHSAVGSALHIRRNYSAPSVQQLLVKGALHDGPREIDINTARTEFKRQKWEQRRLKEDQRQQEEHLKRELLLANKRQRSLQRTLQGLQKQQENSVKNGLPREQLQSARAERRRQESCLWDEERNKESQKIEFLRAQHKQREKQLTEHNQTIEDREKRRLELLRNRQQSMQKNLEAALQEQDIQMKEKETAKRQVFQKWERMSQQVEKEKQKHKDLQQYLQEQNLLTLRASLLS
ncbi:uncharacterized protein LOC123028857 [Varanus komodoensis]|uniref:uncharacterized protein LOC123028857 n=1 Tax=Varanus komodoensis TaxID=61221 RepID=UPI001CF772FF|nr:uncharacterized protein LOC123028857 [Varanus komodoensis]